MKLSIISWLIAKKVLSPAQGRFAEALIIGTVAVAITAGADALSAYTGNGNFSEEAKTAILLALAAGGQYLTKTLRDAAKARSAEELAKI